MYGTPTWLLEILEATCRGQMILSLIEQAGVNRFNTFVREKLSASLRMVVLTTSVTSKLGAEKAWKWLESIQVFPQQFIVKGIMNEVLINYSRSILPNTHWVRVDEHQGRWWRTHQGLAQNGSPFLVAIDQWCEKRWYTAVKHWKVMGILKYTVCIYVYICVCMYVCI